MDVQLKGSHYAYRYTPGATSVVMLIFIDKTN